MIVTCHMSSIHILSFIDIAIGAPYEDERGAVYIYNGGRQGIITTFSQVIYYFNKYLCNNLCFVKSESQLKLILIH
jgi:hypothetical protein